MVISKKGKGKKPGVRAAAAVMALLLAASPSMAYAKTAASENVEKMIGALPAKEEVTENNAGSVRSAMESYMALTFAEQTEISQEMYEKLEEDYRQCVSSGYITDIEKEARAAKEEAERAAREQAALPLSESTEKGVTYYTFEITPDSPAKSITIRYTVDHDGDKTKDPPSRIIVTTPTGEMFEISAKNKDLEKKTEGHYVIYAWEEGFLQLDVAKAENGNWKIETSDPCVFHSMPYAGKRLDITPEKEKTETPVISPEDEGGGGIFLALVGILTIAAAALAAAVKFLGIDLPSLPAPKSRKRGKTGKEEEDEDDEDDELPYEPSDEEVNDLIRAEVRQRKQEAEEMDLSAEDALEEEEEDAGGDDGGYRVYREGETGLLDNENSPFRNGGSLVEGEETEPYTGNAENGAEDDDDIFNDGLFD